MPSGDIRPRSRFGSSDAITTRLSDRYFDGQATLWAVDRVGDDTGSLVSFDVASVGLTVARSFFVRAHDGAVRGGHGHRRGSQLLICVSGEVEVRMRRTRQEASVVLSSVEQGLLIRPGIWSKQIFRGVDPVLNVLSDVPYDPDDYFDDMP